MKFKQKLFVVIGLFIILAVSGVIYVNYKLDKLVASLNQPGMLYTDPNTSASTGDDSDAAGNQEFSGDAGTSGNDSSKNGSSISHPSNGDIVAGAQAQIEKPLEKKDLIKAGVVILQKLNLEEISYLYSVGNDPNRSAKDLQRTREVLLNKLTPEDIETLRELGAKYGKTLKILDPNVPIE